MGCGVSRSREPSVVYGTGQLVHTSRKSYMDVPLLQMYKTIEEELITEIQERRTNRQAATERLIRARGAEGLQARGSLMSIFSTPPDVFGDYLADCPEYVALPTFGSNASNAIPGSVMLSRANEVQEAVEGRGGVGGGGTQPGGPARMQPNAPLLGAALEDVMRLKALWGSRMLAVTLLMVEHPALGRVALVQPLLVAACMQRVYNWAPEVDPVFELLLQAGASPNGRNSLNMTALMLVATSLVTQLESHTAHGNGSGGEALAGKVAAAAAVAGATARLLLAAGADTAAEMRGFGAKWDPSSRAASLLPGPIRAVRHVLQLERYTVHEAFQVMRRTLDEQFHAAGSNAVRHLDEFAKLLLPLTPPRPLVVAAGGQATPPTQQQPPTRSSSAGGAEGCSARGERGQQQDGQQGSPLRHPARDISWPWVQAMSNIAWAVSQVAMAHTASERRAFLRRLRLESPFCLPAMCVVSVGQLRREGCIPRYSAEGSASSTVFQRPNDYNFQPIPVDELPTSAVVVFVSHRWLGRGCPDDDRGTKLKQVLAVADHVAAHRGVPLEVVYLWLDFSVVDQDNPMPGVQALPIYIACCEEFVYIHHEEYWQRAWCLTEQFMHWKLAISEVKHVLRPGDPGGGGGGVSGSGSDVQLVLEAESSRNRPPDPTYGKLAVEADRVALATMTSIMPYEVE